MQCLAVQKPYQFDCNSSSLLCGDSHSRSSPCFEFLAHANTILCRAARSAVFLRHVLEQLKRLDAPLWVHKGSMTSSSHLTRDCLSHFERGPSSLMMVLSQGQTAFQGGLVYLQVFQTQTFILNCVYMGFIHGRSWQSRRFTMGFTQWKGNAEAPLTTGFINLWSDPLERTPEVVRGIGHVCGRSVREPNMFFFRFFLIGRQIQVVAVGLPCGQNCKRRDCVASRLYRLPSP